jgi:hypothetical protein
MSLTWPRASRGDFSIAMPALRSGRPRWRAARFDDRSQAGRPQLKRLALLIEIVVVIVGALNARPGVRQHRLSGLLGNLQPSRNNS